MFSKQNHQTAKPQGFVTKLGLAVIGIFSPQRVSPEIVQESFIAIVELWQAEFR